VPAATGSGHRGIVPRSPRSSTTSSASHTQDAPSRRSRLVPDDITEVTGPGTTATWRDRSAAVRAVLSAPERIAASTTTTPRPQAAMSRLRSRNR
jgi:hypothetical protein